MKEKLERYPKVHPRAMPGTYPSWPSQRQRGRMGPYSDARATCHHIHWSWALRPCLLGVCHREVGSGGPGTLVG